MSRKMTANKLDIFELLRHIDDGDRDFLDGLTEDQRKGFVPIVTLRWLSGSGNESQLLNLNEIANTTTFSLYKHPELLYKLMLASTPKGRKQYNWIKTAKKEKTSLRTDVILRYLDEVSPREAAEFAAIYTAEEILEMAEALGETKEYIQKLKSELK